MLRPPLKPQYRWPHGGDGTGKRDEQLLPLCQAANRDMTCDGLPPFVCDAFGPQPGEIGYRTGSDEESAYYMVSISNSNHCVKCDGFIRPLVTLIVVGVVFIFLLGFYVYFIQKHPESLTQVVSTASILITHVQTLTIIINLRLAWPESVETATNLMLINVLESAEMLRPECLQRDESSHFAAAFAVMRAFVLLLILLLIRSVKRVVNHRCGRRPSLHTRPTEPRPICS